MIIEKGEIEKYQSKCGNRYNEITIEELIEIWRGKVLYIYDGEYANFIYLDNQENGIAFESED